MARASSPSSTFSGSRRAVTLRASGPWLMTQLYRSSRDEAPLGCRKRITALLAPGDWMRTVHTVPSGAEKDLVGADIIAGLTDERREKRLTAGVSGILVVPELNGG